MFIGKVTGNSSAFCATFDLDTTAVVIVSPNGMGLSRAQNHFLPQILSRLNAVYLEQLGNGGSRRKDRFNLTAVLRDKVPYSMQYWAATLLGEPVQDWVVNRTFTGVSTGRGP